MYERILFLSYRDKLADFTDREAADIKASFLHFYQIIRTLRAPNGCPWDRKQTPHSLGPNLLEEVYELIDAIENEDLPNAREELGDILLVALMIASIYEEKNSFTLPQVLEEISAKLVRRHPHVFGDIAEDDPEEVVKLWNHIKTNVEKNGEETTSIFNSIPRTMPPLERAYKIQKKAAKVGFDWDSVDGVFAKIHEELDELKSALASVKGQEQIESEHAAIEDEIGDLLFSVINISRFLDTKPDIALHRTNKKFLERFEYIEKKMSEKKLALEKANFQLMDDLWNEAKKRNKI
jgi:tetrapyrrole methylase family protein/MazG family protein